MSELKKTKYSGTQTEKNLQAAFSGESEARNKYTAAKLSGYVRELPYISDSDCTTGTEQNKPKPTA